MDKDRCYVRHEPGKVDPERRLMANRVNIAGIGWIVGFASSVDSAALPQAAKEFGVSEVTESLATGLFLIGFGCGTSQISYFDCWGHQAILSVLQTTRTWILYPEISTPVNLDELVSSQPVKVYLHLDGRKLHA